MALSKLDSLYKAVVTDHTKTPHHRGLLPEQAPHTLHNPTCGDVLSLSLELVDDRIAAIGWDGDGCSISLASASMMADSVLGLSVTDALAMAELFSQMVQGEPSDPRQKELGDAQFLSGVSKFPQRIKCATLAWKGLEKALSDIEDR
ncbi:Fe-S cluster assembly sulfur transfer protein SufU [Streptococcus sp. E17BB]|uniref:Fe-S cluster assembly sulfur transfer protein SufU n=1 Tax=Streptococcus sp. E17BB TaxID=3278714 RepID=UPI00359DDA20